MNLPLLHTSLPETSFDLADLLGSLAEPIALFDETGLLTAFNEAAAASFLLLHRNELAIGRSVFEVVRPSDRESLKGLFGEVLDGNTREVVRSHELSNGQVRVFRNTLRPLQREGRSVGVIVQSQDITRQHKAAHALRESNERFERAVTASFDMIWEHDLRTNRISLSTQYRLQLGHEEAEMDIADFAEHVVHPDDRGMIAERAADFIASNRMHLQLPVHRLRKCDGSHVYVEARAVASRNAAGKAYLVTGVTRDVTERYLMEQALRESNERFERAMEASFDMLWEADLRRDSTFFNERFYSVMGYAPGEVSTRSDFFDRLLHPGDRAFMLQEMNAFLESNREFMTPSVYRMRRKDDSFIYVEARLRLTRDAAGSPLLLTGVTRDVTEERINALELNSLNKRLKVKATELQESIERYDLVARATSDVVWDWDLRTNANWFNSNFGQLFGYPEEEAGNDIKAWESRLHPADSKRVLDSVHQAIREKQPKWESEYRFRRRDGSWAIIYDRGQTLYDEAGTPARMIGSMQDITHLSELQEKMLAEQARHQQSLTEAVIRSQEQERANLGRELHDNINQILTSCQLMTDMAVREPSLRDTVLPRTHAQLGMAVEEIRRLSHSLVQPALGDIDVSDALRDLLNEPCVAQGLRSTLHIGDSLAPLDEQSSLMLYRIAQEQLQNIRKHARAAHVSVTLEEAAGVVRLVIEDDGIGFDPTARKGGIGMRNMQTRVQLCGGTFAIESTPGAGCRVVVELPRSA